MLVLHGGSVITDKGLIRKDLYINTKTGKIAEGPDRSNQIVDVTGRILFPGFIDSHTHLDMPVAGTRTADDFRSGTAAALVGGTTCILDFATQDRGHTLAEALDTWHRRADKKCACDYGFHMAVTDWNDQTRQELLTMPDKGVTSFKAYMAYPALRLTDEELFSLLKTTGQMGAWVGVHCELGDEVEANTKALLEAGKTAPYWHACSRPNAVEGDAVRRLMELAKEADAPVWIVHLSTKEGLRAIRSARREGCRVLAETCPQYLTLDESLYAIPGFESARYVCSPPLRSKADQGMLWDAVQKREINLISTDHCCFRYEDQKTLGREDFSKIPNGLPAIELRPALIWNAVAAGKLSVGDMAGLLSEMPARAFGMWPQKGSLEVGADADVVVWDPTWRGTVKAANLLTASDYSPWEGTPLSGRAEMVYLRGRLSAEKGAVLRKTGGKFIKRTLSQG